MAGCAVRDEDLIAYEDGYLTGGRLELVEAHIQVRCPSCQGRIAAFREVGEIIRAAAPMIPMIDVQRSREELLRRLDAAAMDRRPRFPKSVFSWRRWRAR